MYCISSTPWPHFPLGSNGTGRPHRTQRMNPSSLAVVALGSNLGDSVGIIRSAMNRLEEYSSARLLRSSLFRSTPVNCPPGAPEFINAVAGLVPQPSETPETLLDKLQALERAFGRRRGNVVNAPRPLDLDLIAFGGETRETPRLTLPHPRAHRRRFVLEPFVEIAPHYRLAGMSETVTELLAGLDAGETVKRLTSR